MGVIVYHTGNARFVARSNGNLRVDISSFKSKSPLVSRLKDTLETARDRNKPGLYERESVQRAIREVGVCAREENSQVALFEMTALLSESYMHAVMRTRGVFAFIRRKILFFCIDKHGVNADQVNAKEYANEIGNILHNSLGIRKISFVISDWTARVLGVLVMGISVSVMAWSSVLTAIDSVKTFSENGVFVAVGEMTGAIVMGGSALLAGWLAQFVAFGVTQKINPTEQIDVNTVQPKSAETTGAV